MRVKRRERGKIKLILGVCEECEGDRLKRYGVLMCFSKEFGEGFDSV